MSSSENDWKAKAVVLGKAGGQWGGFSAKKCGELAVHGWVSSADLRGSCKEFLCSKKWGMPHVVWLYVLILHMFVYATLHNCHC